MGFVDPLGLDRYDSDLALHNNSHWSASFNPISAPKLGGSVYLGAGGSYQFGIPRLAADSGVVFNFSEPNICIYSSICGGMGLGASGQLGFIAAQSTESKLCSGSTNTASFFRNGGNGFMSGLDVTTDGKNISASKVFFGFGEGVGGGFGQCRVTKICLKN